jgi:hypothetical protein
MTHTPDLTSGLAVRTLAVIAEKLDLPDDLLDELGADADPSIEAMDEAEQLALYRTVLDDFSRIGPEYEAIASSATAQAGRMRGDVAQVLLEYADFLPLLLVIAAAKLKLSVRAGKHFAADAELSFKADLPRLRKAIQEQLPGAGREG